MSDLEFHLQGPQSDATAAALEMFFAETFGEKARRENPRIPPSGETEKAADPIAVAALILRTCLEITRSSFIRGSG